MTPTRRLALFLALALSGCGGGGATGGSGGDDGGGSRTSGVLPGAPSGGAQNPDFGPGASLDGYRFFPDDNEWNRRVDGDEVDPASDVLIASIGVGGYLHPDFGADWNGGPFGIPYVVVGAGQTTVPVTFGYDDESDPGPYPIPSDAPVEGGYASSGDRHVLVFDRDAQRLYETFDSWPNATGWDCGSGAVFDTASNVLRPDGWTSADAAGLPILPGLVRWDEVVEQGEIRHALRFTVRYTRHAYVSPARHYASDDTDPTLPPMGMRVRLKGTFDVSTFSPQARVVLVAMQRYGMFVADNGSDWYVSGAPDARWDDDQLNELKTVPGSAFEVVRMGPLTTD